MALSTNLIYSVMAYFVKSIRGICASGRRTMDTTPSYKNIFKWFCKIILEWLKAMVAVICLREQGITYEPNLMYNTLTFTYYICTEKIFFDIILSAVEHMELEMMNSLEQMYVPLVLNLLAVVAGVCITLYTSAAEYYPFIIISAYFIVYLKIKDIYYNYWELILPDMKIFCSFKFATAEDIQKWDDICAVCLNKMTRAKITPCKHLFHPYCLKRCLKISHYCPLCKQTFDENGSK